MNRFLVVAALAIALLLWQFSKWESLPKMQVEAARYFTQTVCPPGIERFKGDMGRYPTTEEGIAALVPAPEGKGAQWKGPYLDRSVIPEDPWGRDYSYRTHRERRDSLTKSSVSDRTGRLAMTTSGISRSEK